MEVTSQQLKMILHTIAYKMDSEKEHLSDLDRELGDGDHGITMSLGWRAIKEALADMPENTDCGLLCKTAGMTFLNAVGSSVGPLYATAFMRAGAAVKEKMALSEEDLLSFWTAFVEGIIERGKAAVGDKTMVDVWAPALESLREGYRHGKDVHASFRDAVSAGRAGMIATAEMVSRKGRSSRLGNRSLSHQDPGAVSAYLILSVFADMLESIDSKDGGSE
ncbi:dihydroxyacetone kinase subunit L [Paenibacillus baekrokdamisoli]|uniref:phosphoenolpyruvate--glycerone phosphotransferase n=1 Tax=Paenibacillus baekrokdamisoli TaxID=1712516 RepID=A0A3G9IZX0_9BACL|nr:dihydroxyacetone kinase subunit DhaL [Paenibacillus baekrokdamisoli]MBB3071472.1 dihydroxyacetone kinase-like protein [Paenibacillus baekrokdamisoli]BBH24497.1 dihydroxyacetone kinase subunit L [Paenibacillus baekrokdamisoli]